MSSISSNTQTFIYNFAIKNKLIKQKPYVCECHKCKLSKIIKVHESRRFYKRSGVINSKNLDQHVHLDECNNIPIFS